jgi:type IV pilus assembly protein PilN
MKVVLNLATSPLQTHRKFLALSGVLGAMAAVVFLALGWHVYTVLQSEASIRARADQVHQEMTGLIHQRSELQKFFAQDQNARLAERSAFLNSLIDEQSLNWTQMFMDLEKILPSGVRLVSIQPKSEKGRVEVKLRIGAINDEAKLKFLRQLEGSSVFREVRELTDINSDLQPGAPASDRLQVELTVVYARS